MMTPITILLTALLQLQSAAAPKIGVELHAAHATVPPGGQTELAVTITVPDDWHAYHPIILDTGAATSISFEAPAGITFGDLRFPTPYFGSDGGLDYLAHAGEFTVLTTISVADDVAVGSYPIAAKVDALVCKELCVPVDAMARLALAVSPEEQVATHTELFEQARAALPKPLKNAPYLAGSTATLTRSTVGIDGETELVLTAKIKDGHHFWDRDPGSEDFIPPVLAIEKIDGLKIGAQKWPEPKIRTERFVGTLREHHGNVEIRVPIKLIDNKFPTADVPLRVLFTYQVCDDAGMCFPPEAAETVVTLTADTPNEALAAGASLSHFVPDVTRVAAQPGGMSIDGTVATIAQPAGLWWQLMAAFLGGLILNVMPCVFPVISIKVLSFVKQAGEDRGQILRLGLVFSLGIMAWFWIFALLTSMGELPWQHPPVLIALATFLFVFALNLFGVFEIVLPGDAATKLTEASSREGYAGSFMKGFLATLLGTACTAPFFAGAAAYAAAQPLAVSLLIFTFAGFGMSSPYILLAAFPGWLNEMPKPGNWMVVFKQAMGFILLATVVWLLTILADQLDARGVVWTVALMGFAGLAVWLLGMIGFNWSAGARTTTWISSAAVLVIGVWFSMFYMYDLRDAIRPEVAAEINPEELADEILADMATATWDEHVPWQPYAPGAPEVLAERGYTVFVDFTATWCITCQTNKATAIDVSSTRARMKELGVIPLKADWTKRDPQIRNVLMEFDNNSVPMNLVYPAGRPDAPVKLPLVLTPGIVQDRLAEAGASTAKSELARRAP